MAGFQVATHGRFWVAAEVNEINRLRKDGVTSDELKKGIAYSVGEHEIGLQTRTSMVLEYATAVYSGEGIQGVTNYARFVSGVTSDQVKKAAETYLNPEAATIVIVRGVKK